MEIKNWPVGVNRIILSDSGFGHNKNAVISDKSENGSEMSRLSASGSPDEWKVNMYFSNSRNDSFFKKYGETEWERFVKWFKYGISMGTLPFYFSKVGDTEEKKVCVYKIRSDGMPNYTFQGINVRVSMTWLEVFNDYISVTFDEPHIDSLCALNGHVEMWYSDRPEVTPEKEQFAFTYDFTGEDGSFTHEELVMEDFLYDGNKSCVFYYPSFETKGIYEITLVQTFVNAEGEEETIEISDRFEV